MLPGPSWQRWSLFPPPLESGLDLWLDLTNRMKRKWYRVSSKLKTPHRPFSFSAHLLEHYHQVKGPRQPVRGWDPMWSHPSHLCWGPNIWVSLRKISTRNAQLSPATANLENQKVMSDCSLHPRLGVVCYTASLAVTLGNVIRTQRKSLKKDSRGSYQKSGPTTFPCTAVLRKWPCDIGKRLANVSSFPLHWAVFFPPFFNGF